MPYVSILACPVVAALSSPLQLARDAAGLVFSTLVRARTGSARGGGALSAVPF